MSRRARRMAVVVVVAAFVGTSGGARADTPTTLNPAFVGAVETCVHVESDVISCGVRVVARRSAASAPCERRILARWRQSRKVPRRASPWCAALILARPTDSDLRVALIDRFVGRATGNPTTADQRCVDLVLTDWYRDGRLDTIYPHTCLALTLRTAPRDLLTYSALPADLLLAAAFARHGKLTPERAAERLHSLHTQASEPGGSVLTP